MPGRGHCREETFQFRATMGAEWHCDFQPQRAQETSSPHPHPPGPSSQAFGGSDPSIAAHRWRGLRQEASLPQFAHL